MSKTRRPKPARTGLVALAVSCVAVLAACGGSEGGGGAASGGGGEEPLQITAATYFPPSYNDLYPSFDIFMKESESASNGAISYEWYDSGTLLEADQLVPGLTQGVADLIFTTSSYISSTYPILGVYELPFLTTEFERQRELLGFDGEVRSFLNEQLGEQNLMSLGTIPMTFQWLWTVDEPITSPEDVRGLRIRVAGPLEGRTIEALGGSPVTMSSAEVYEALERGTIDGLMSYIGTIPGRSLEEVVKYGTRAPFGAYSMDAYVRADWFQGLPQAHQDALTQAGKTYTDEGTEHMVQVHEGEYLDIIEGAGVEVVDLNAEQIAAFEDAVAPTYEQWKQTVKDEATAERALELMGQ